MFCICKSGKNKYASYFLLQLSMIRKPEHNITVTLWLDNNSNGTAMLQLMREAEMHLGQLTSMLRAPGVAALPGTVAIVAVKAAGSIAQQRPFFITKVLPVLLGLGLAQVCPLSGI